MSPCKVSVLPFRCSIYLLLQVFFLKPLETDDLFVDYQRTATCKRRFGKFKVIIISIDIYYAIFNNELLFVKAAVM